MKLRLTLLIFGATLCGALTWALLRAQEETCRQQAERAVVESSDRELEQRMTSLKAELAATTNEITKTRLMLAASLDPATRARSAVGPLIARLKQEHTLHPPPALPVPPPHGPQGDIFPELMSYPEYNRLYSITVRVQIEGQHRALLKKLGVQPELADQVIDLLTEREMVATDHRSIIGPRQGTPSDIYEKYQAYRDDVDAKIHTLLGDQGYHDFTEETVRDVFSRDANGVPKTTRTVTRGIPDYRRPADYVPGVQPLELRLSYSSSPLTEAQKQILRDWGSENPIRTSVMRDEPFLKKVSEVLRPEQQFAIDELKAEDAARGAREKLPKTETTPSKPKP